MRGKDQARLAVLLTPLAWVIGGVLGSLPDAPLLAAPSWTAFLVGGLVAADLRLPIAVTGTLIVALTIVLGYPNGLAMAASGQGARAVIGSTAAIFVLVTLVAALAAGTTVAWIRIAWRVVGSWTAATGVLLFGWSLR